jgi:ethanolaminephosphotransferase
MCINPLQRDTLDNLTQYRYKYKNDSILYGHCMSPLLDKLVVFLPMKLAPNLITFFSLMCNIIAFVFSVFDGGFDFSQPLKRLTCFIIGFTQIFYSLLDNIDGKQARRTGNSTPFGMLMDHGCDIFTNIFTAYNMSRLLIVGNDDFFSYSVFFGLLVGFYYMTYEDYKLGEMYFPPINGADEGNFAVFLIGVACGIFGQGWMQYVLFSKLPSLTIGKIIAAVIALGGLSAVVNLYIHTYKKKGCIENIKNFFDNMSFYACVIVPFIYIYHKKVFYENTKWILIIQACLIFARVTLDIQIKMATIDSFRCSIMFFFSNFILILSLFITDNIINFYLLGFSSVFQFCELMVFIFFRATEITNHLGIRIFLINPTENKV